MPNVLIQRRRGRFNRRAFTHTLSPLFTNTRKIQRADGESLRRVLKQTLAHTQYGTLTRSVKKRYRCRFALLLFFTAKKQGEKKIRQQSRPNIEEARKIKIV